MDKHPFLDYRSSSTDILMAYDYTDLDMDVRVLAGYDSIRIVAWSMGVWAASVLMAGCPGLCVDAIAVNGTPFPVDPDRGIPPPIFNATLAGLSTERLRRFDRRMCADADVLRVYDQHHPRRSPDRLARELASIGRASAARPVDPRFLRAYVGRRDAIFAPANQEAAWEGLCVCEAVDAAHYPPALLRALVCEGVGHG